jgi:hypothetical protein
MLGSKQIKIPRIISKELGINYRPVSLNEEFEEKYEQYALKALEFSNGTAPFMRANFPYAFEQLSRFSSVNIAGIFGSEIIKPIFYTTNERINCIVINLFTGNDFNQSFEKAISKIRNIGYVKGEIINKYCEEIKKYLKDNYIDKFKQFSPLQRFYIFALEESLRKYFMQEMMMERYYVETRTPYLDDDFLELIFKTPFAGIYKASVVNGLLRRKESQLFYAKLIHKFKPILGSIATDKGFAPDALLLPFLPKLLKVGLLYSKERIKVMIKGNDSFMSDVWSKGLRQKYMCAIGRADNIFTDKLVDDFQKNRSLKGNMSFYHIFSLRLWLYLLGR